MSKNFLFSLPGITCFDCVTPVENVLKNCEKIKIESTSVDVVEKKILITVADESQFVQNISGILHDEIESVGVECLDITEMPAPIVPPTISADTQEKDALEITILKQRKNQQSVIYSHIIKGAIGSILGLACMGIMMFGVCLSPSLMFILTLFSSALTFYLGKESYYDAYKKLRKSKTLTMDTLFSVSTLVVMGVTFASFLFPWLPRMMETGSMIFGFRHLGKAIEESIKQKVIAGLSFKERAASQVEKKIQTKEGVKWMKCMSNHLLPDDIIRIKNGDVIPVDGICEDARSSIYDTIISGSTLPRAIKRGDAILAGMKVADDMTSMHIRVMRTCNNSYLARLDEKILKANAEKAPIENATHKILQYFVPAVLGFAALSGVVVGFLFDLTLGIKYATSLLVSFCPCTLGFITPLAIKIEISKAMENGVQVKSGKALQAADQINTVLFDLNGTLTTGIPKVKDYYICTDEKILPHEFFHYLSLLERESQHPIAKSICEYIENKKLPKPQGYSMRDVDRTHHAGIKAKINGERVIAGNKQCMLEEGIDVSRLENAFKHEDCQQIIFLSKGSKLLGSIALQDPLRDDAKLAIHELKRMGKDVCICTGADLDTALHYAAQLGIPQNKVFANCVGASDNHQVLSKTTIIKRLQKAGNKVAMIGDAANDTVPIAESDLGIAIKSRAGDEMTQQEAGVLLDNASLLPVVTTFAIAKEAVKSIKQNLIFSLAYNTTLVLGSSLLIPMKIALNAVIGVSLMGLQTSLILLNQYRIKCKQLSHLTQPATMDHDNQLPLEMTYQYFKKTGIHLFKRPTFSPSVEKKFLPEINAIRKLPSIPYSPQMEGPVLVDKWVRCKAF